MNFKLPLRAFCYNVFLLNQADPIMEITREIFIKAVGEEPQNDDLERCNCSQSGEMGHMFCGWNQLKNGPVFIHGPEPK